MNKKAVLATIIFTLLGWAPTMAQMVELADPELELITGQASEIGVPQIFAGVDASQLRTDFQLDSLDLIALTQGLEGAEFVLARTTISIDSISANTLMGQVEIRNIAVDMEAGATVRFF